MVTFVRSNVMGMFLVCKTKFEKLVLQKQKVEHEIFKLNVTKTILFVAFYNLTFQRRSSQFPYMKNNNGIFFRPRLKIRNPE